MDLATDLLILFSWAFMIIGPLTGLYMGSFEDDGAFGDYTAPKRRTFRIAHINCFVFPYMGIMWALSVEQAALPTLAVQIGAICMAISTLFMTVPMFASIRWPSARYAVLIGAVSLLVGIAVIVGGYVTKLFLA